MAVSFIGAASGQASATLPAHAVGDLIIVFAIRDGSTTAPGLPAGHDYGTDTLTWAGTTCAGRLSWKIADTTSEATGTFGQTSCLIAHVYRGAEIGDIATGGGAAADVTYPAIPGFSGSAWAMRVAGHREGDTALETPPGSYTHRQTRNMVGANPAEAASFDTNGDVASVISEDVAVGGTASGWVAASIEILAAGAAGSSGSLSGTEGADAGALTGDVLVQGSISGTEGADSSSLSGDVVVSGSFTGTDGADAGAFSGAVASSEVAGFLAAVEGADEAIFSGEAESPPATPPTERIWPGFRPYAGEDAKLAKALRAAYVKIRSMDGLPDETVGWALSAIARGMTEGFPGFLPPADVVDWDVLADGEAGTSLLAAFNRIIAGLSPQKAERKPRKVKHLGKAPKAKKHGPTPEEIEAEDDEDWLLLAV
jgi:hypothetical protein